MAEPVADNKDSETRALVPAIGESDVVPHAIPHETFAPGLRDSLTLSATLSPRGPRIILNRRYVRRRTIAQFETDKSAMDICLQ